MILLLLRHGAAEDVDPDGPITADAARRLTPKGEQRTRRTLRALRSELGVEGILSSPLVRAWQTAEIAAEVLGVDTLRRTKALAPGASAADLLQMVTKLRANVVMAVGHAPHLDQVLATAVGGRGTITKLEKSGLAALELADEGRGRLLWTLGPRLVEAIRRRS